MNLPLISVIIPIYNVEKYLPRCIESVISQSYKNLEIILVNDGSTDNCSKICDNYLLKDSRISVIHKKNGGASSARNEGLEKVRGEYITFVDSDDYIHPLFVEKLFRLCEDHRCKLAQCDFEQGTEDEFNERPQKAITKIMSKENLFDTREFKIIPCGKLYHKSLFLDVRFPEGKIHEDEFVTYKLGYYANQVVLTNEKMYYYFQSPNSVMRNNSKFIKLDFIEAYTERIEFFDTKDEVKLKNISIKEYCIRLMLYFIKLKNSQNNIKQSKFVFDLFKENYNLIRKEKFICIKEKIILMTFLYFPNVFSKIIKLMGVSK